MSYRKRHIKSKHLLTRPKKSIFKMLWFWISILILLVILSISYLIIFYSGFQIKNIVISGNNKVNAQDLQNIISNHANTGLINIGSAKVTSRSIFLVNNENINKDILKGFPIIEKLTINKKFPQTLIVGVKERAPIGVFCTSDVNSNCFLIDQNGVIFSQLTVPAEGATIIKNIIGNNTVSAGDKVIGQNIINVIYKIQETLKNNYKINLKEALVTSPIRLEADTSENWNIYFDLSSGSDIDSQLKKLDLLLTKNFPADKRNSLRYINLIPKDRAIVCDNNVCGK